MAFVSQHRSLAGHRLLDPRFAQRVARSLAVTLLIVAAAAATYAVIPSAMVTTDVQNLMVVQHNRWGEVGRPQAILLRIGRSAGESVSIRINDADGFMLDRSEPVAKTVTSDTGDGTILTFDSPPNSDTFDVKMVVRPTTWGQHALSLTASIAQRVSAQATLSQFVIP